MRLIDADAYAAEMKKRQDACKERIDNPTGDVYTDGEHWGGVFAAFVEAKLILDAAPTIGGWISADKRPPKQGRYLVWGLTRVIPDHNDEPNQYWQTKIAQWFEGIGWECKVKFWQMLPEPPEEMQK